MYGKDLPGFQPGVSCCWRTRQGPVRREDILMDDGVDLNSYTFLPAASTIRDNPPYSSTLSLSPCRK